MYKFVLILFLSLPILELYLFFKLSSIFGTFQTLLLVIFTSGIGILILKICKITSFLSIKTHNDLTNLGIKKIFILLCRIMGGLLLVFPGFLTDCTAFFILLPFVQNYLFKTIELKFSLFLRENLSSNDPTNDIIDADYIYIDKNK